MLSRNWRTSGVQSDQLAELFSAFHLISSKFDLPDPSLQLQQRPDTGAIRYIKSRSDHQSSKINPHTQVTVLSRYNDSDVTMIPNDEHTSLPRGDSASLQHFGSNDGNAHQNEVSIIPIISWVNEYRQSLHFLSIVL